MQAKAREESPDLPTITDDFMRSMLAKSKQYCLLILKRGPKANDPAAKQIIWEHGRRNFELRAAGSLCIVCPVNDGSDVAGLGIFTTDAEETKRIMDGDPGVQAGIFEYELHVCRSFPGDALPS